MRLLTLAAVLPLVVAAPAWADGPIATAGNPAQMSAPQPADAAPPLPTDPSLTAGAGQPLVMGPCGPTKAKADGAPDSSPHGEVEAGVGTHGYRELAGSVCKPIGDTGAVSVSVGESQGGWRWGPR